MARFSNRTAWDLRPDELVEVANAMRANATPLHDLTVSNPTTCGFAYDVHAILEPLLEAQALVYDPDPRGLLSARESVAGYYADHDAQLAPGQIVLTTSTSEAYSFLFRLLCDPGDTVLFAQPGYPLFDFLATLDDVVLSSYPLFYDFGWWIDFSELERRITPRTRAIVVVHPNNPTGHVTRRTERLLLEALCVRHRLALIVDEVFLDYPVDLPDVSATVTRIESFACGPHPCLTFVVSGISKICALPQMKVGWIAAFGPEPECQEALSRLEVVADTFLSLSAPAQYALPHWLAGRAFMTQQLADRVRKNLVVLSAAGSQGVQHLPVEAGWCAVLRLPATLLQEGDDGLAEVLLRQCRVLVHPGSFYGMSGKHLVVVSLIVQTEEFEAGIQSLVRLYMNQSVLQG
jgi:alanine-synthesizing transaminase